jgi:hypothetical protein
MIKLNNILKEIQPKVKPEIGVGNWQTVYNSTVNPNYVIKRYNAGKDLYDPKEWDKVYKVAQQHPDLFAKFVKVNLEKGYAVQEKLDEKTLTQDCKEVQEYLLTNNTDPDYSKEKSDIIEFFYENPNKLSILNNTPWKDTLKPKLEKFYYNIAQVKSGPDKEYLKYLRDIRMTNVGYDKNQNIKILDFLI